MVKLKPGMTKIILIYLLSVLFFWVILPMVVIVPGLFLDKLFGFPQIIYPHYNLILAAIFLVFGIFWALWALHSLIIIGKGNPQEAFGKEILPATQKLITIGPYRYTRNPMGFGWFSFVVGIGFYLGSISLLVIALPIFLTGVIYYLKYFEEQNLIERFGDDYLKYRKEVPIFFPGLGMRAKGE
jgi:protein-S-isoprenylcysteine O-methyltransferase Ste14